MLLTGLRRAKEIRDDGAIYGAELVKRWQDALGCTGSIRREVGRSSRRRLETSEARLVGETRSYSLNWPRFCLDNGEHLTDRRHATSAEWEPPLADSSDKSRFLIITVVSHLFGLH